MDWLPAALSLGAALVGGGIGWVAGVRRASPRTTASSPPPPREPPEPASVPPRVPPPRGGSNLEAPQLRAAQDRARRLELMVEGLPMAVAAVHVPTQRVSFGNHAFRTLFGLMPEQVTDLSLEQLLDPTSGAKPETFREMAFAEDGSSRTLQLKRMDGAVFLGRVRARLQRKTTGAPDTMMVSFEDITAERASDERREMLVAAIEGTKDGVILTDRIGLITFANHAAGELYGLTPEAMLGRSLTEFHGEAPGAEMFDENLRGDASWHGDLPRLSPGHERRPTRVAVSAVRQDGRATGFVAVVQDLSQEHELHEQALRSQKLATLGELAAALTHEIGNPLAYLMTNTKMLRDDLRAHPELAALREMADDCMGGVERISSIVSEVRRFAYMGQAGPEPARTHFSDALEAALTLAGSRLRQHTVVRPVGDGPWIMANQGHLTQVLLNLIVNAAQALESVKRQGSIRFEQGEGEGTVWLKVIDDGPGIRPEVKARLFRDYVTTKAKGEGTGFGLRICHKLIDAMGGQLTVESEVGKGATFTISLPASAEVVPRDDMPGPRPLRASLEAFG